ncbi:ACT domain-containing protein [Sneathiella glossodoripedis]|uniref:ACT domain-containing protein n=1 Tax=Sneathiella glossodoripedis TaxID=418853 RepID=UPI000471348E|nr:ACT domain-containing protein [Sneathiella glossodoripedis]
MATYKALLTVFSPDRVGLISEVTGLLFDHGVNIGDTSFSILGKGGGFNSIVEIPQDLSEQDLINALKSLASLIDADIDLKRFSLPDQEAPPKSVTHQIWFEGSDQPVC